MLDAMIGLRKKIGKKRHSSARLQAIRTYLLAILVLTFLLFSASLVSLVSQQQAVQGLSISNLIFDGERVAISLDRDVTARAAVCLDRNRLKDVRYSPGDESSPQKMRAIRKLFDKVREGNPVARHFFLWSGNKMVFPGLSTPLELMESMVASDPSPEAGRFAVLIRAGENAESGVRPQPEDAIRLYRQAASLPVSPRLKALALFRTARAMREARGTAASIPVYRDLVELYGDEYNQSGMPYKLAMAIEAHDLAKGIFPMYPQLLEKLYQEVIGGSWELSAEQAEDALAQIEQRLGLKSSARQRSEFLDHLAAAQAAGGQFQVVPALQSGTVRARGFKQGNKNCQMFCVLLPESQGHDLIAGFTVSASWLQQELLPRSLVNLPATAKVTAFIDEASGGDKIVETANDLYIPLPAGLASWRLRIPTASIQHGEVDAHRELWFLAASSAMFLCILSLGVYLLIRVSRDIHWFQVRSDFISGVSHELKTPLSLIRLYSETLADGELNYPAEERHNYIRIIARESDRLSHLIDNILDFSRIERGGKRYELQEADLAATVKQTIEDYSEYLLLRGFEIKTSLQPCLPPVKFNREQISQMLLNLLDNARKYSDKSRLIRVHMWRQENAVVLEVQDHGFGIPPEEQEKIFEPFYRVPKGSEKGGCGLGLFLVRNVIEGHGGRIEVLSEVGKGSRFRLHFPIGEAAQEGHKETAGVDRESWWKKAEI